MNIKAIALLMCLAHGSLYGMDHADFNNKRDKYRAAVKKALDAGVHPQDPLMRRHLYTALMEFDDLPSAENLLKHGVSANQYPIVFAAQTVAMAELLKKYGARFDVKEYNGSNLLHNIFIDDNSVQLIKFYIANGVSPYEERADGTSALVMGINFYQRFIDRAPISGNVTERIKAFLDAGIPPEKIQETFDSGKANKEYLPLFLAIAAEPSLENYDNCFICFDRPGSEHIPCTNRHSDKICPVCLKQIQTCPLCREKLNEY